MGKSRIVAFRCPDKLYNTYLKDADNKSKVIKNLLHAYLQFDTLFKKISNHFKEGRKTLSIEEFFQLTEDFIDYDLIDEIGEEIE